MEKPFPRQPSDFLERPRLGKQVRGTRDNVELSWTFQKIVGLSGSRPNDDLVVSPDDQPGCCRSPGPRHRGPGRAALRACDTIAPIDPLSCPAASNAAPAPVLAPK